MDRRQPTLFWQLVTSAAYAAALALGWPIYVYLLATRAKYRHRWWERWGLVPRMDPTRRRIWVHAISVGEVMAARTFVPALADALPACEIVLSTTTMTGYRRARELFPDRTVFHFPVDLWPAVATALDRVAPEAVVQVESEWWPTFFLEAERRGIPVAVVNLRMTESSRRGYAHVRPLMRTVINTCRAVGVQADLYADRLRSLGANPRRMAVTGQMKHDTVTFRDHVPGAEALAEACGLDPRAPTIVAGSTGPGEEPILLEAYRRVLESHPDARLVVVPRRPETFDSAARAITSAEMGCFRRSTNAREGPADAPTVILGDTMGELMAWYALADVVVIGRTFVPIGGSNPMEPGSLGRPMLWGPEMFNFPVEAPALECAQAAIRLDTAEELARAADELLTSEPLRRQMGEAARETIRGLQGATDRNVRLVVDMLEAAARERNRRP